MEGTTPTHPILCIWRHDSIIRHRMAASGFKHPGRTVQSSGPANECQENGRNGLLSLSGRGHPFLGVIRATDDKHRTIVPGEAASQGAVFGIWGRNGFGVAGSPSTDAAQDGIGREA